MKTKRRIALIAGILVGIFWIRLPQTITSNTERYEAELDSLKSLVRKKDSVIFMLQVQADTIRQERDFIKIELDTTISLIKELTLPDINEADRADAMIWINEYNSSLQP